jgi:hypothetical protein
VQPDARHALQTFVQAPTCAPTPHPPAPPCPCRQNLRQSTLEGFGTRPAGPRVAVEGSAGGVSTRTRGEWLPQAAASWRGLLPAISTPGPKHSFALNQPSRLTRSIATVSFGRLARGAVVRRLPPAAPASSPLPPPACSRASPSGSFWSWSLFAGHDGRGDAAGMHSGWGNSGRFEWQHALQPGGDAAPLAPRPASRPLRSGLTVHGRLAPRAIPAACQTLWGRGEFWRPPDLLVWDRVMGCAGTTDIHI